MKFILFNLNDANKNAIYKIALDSANYISEISLSKNILNELDKEPKSFVDKVKHKFYDITIERKILKALGHHDKKWYYIMSNSMPNSKYLSNKLESLLGYKLTGTYELDGNITKYIDEYLKKNDLLKKHELKVLLVATSNKSLNFSLVNNLINQYKLVNIYLNEKPSSYTLKKIKEINKTEGTAIEIVKKERKTFGEYNVVYFVDDVKQSYPRLRLGKNALVIDLETARTDKFNSNIIFVNEYISKQDGLHENIEYLMKTYNSLDISRIVKKIVNVLDKS